MGAAARMSRIPFSASGKVFRSFVSLTILIIFLSACSSPLDLAALTPSAPTGQGNASPASWYQVFFTDPSQSENGPDLALAAAITGARSSVDVAIYDFDLESISQALISAAQSGIRVRMVTDSDNLDEAGIQTVKAAGIPVLGDRHEGLMHNKFTVIDQSEVWTGSMNYSQTDTYQNNNNLIRIRSEKLAQDYTAEFEEMFTQDRFGPDKLANTPNPLISVHGTAIEVFFSPSDRPSSRLKELLSEARQSIYFLAFSFTSDTLGKAIVERAKAGVTVAGVMEASQVESNTGTEWDRFQKAGLDVRQDGNPKNMHHKVIIIDEQIVVTGSYNFSANAERTNDENLLIIHDAGLAQQYLAEFQKVFGQALR
jgi:phosphatidylserine/phosphatidylglycerophosphate/cardiolipin synthase-like enzyme